MHQEGCGRKWLRLYFGSHPDVCLERLGKITQLQVIRVLIKVQTGHLLSTNQKCYNLRYLILFGGLLFWEYCFNCWKVVSGVSFCHAWNVGAVDIALIHL